MKVRSLTLSLMALAMLVLAAQIAQAQSVAKKKRLRSPATVKGFIGGESQDQYLIKARKGQQLTVRISWRNEENNTASFSVGPVSQSAEPLTGTESDGGKSWTGKIPKSADYVIAVVAHPTAHYTLKVRLK